MNMKKFYLFLLALILQMGGATWAEGVPTVDGIQNGYIYTLKTSRNAITWDGSSTNCVGAALDESNVNHQFVAMKVDGSTNQFYFYNVGAQKFMGKSGTNASLTYQPEVYWIVKTSGDETWPLMIDSQDGNHFNFGGSGQITVDGWSTADAGNKFQIAQISEADANIITTIQERINQAEVLVPARAAVNNVSDSRVGAFKTTMVSELQAALTAYDYTPSDDNFNAVKSAYNSLKNLTDAKVALKEGNVFTVQCYDAARGYMVYSNSTDAAKAHQTNVMLAGTGSSFESHCPALEDEGVYKKWAYIEVEGKGYIFNVQKKQFIKYGNAITFSDNGTPITYNAYTEVEPTILEIKFEGGGNNHLSFSPGYSNNQGVVRTWDGTDGGTKFYVDLVDETIEQSLVNEMKDKITGTIAETFNALKSAQKFDILEGSVVVGPSEFANPVQINDAIDAAQLVDDTYSAKSAFIASDNGQMIQNYLNKVQQYGSLANVQFEMTGEYGTLCMPCPSSPVGGLKMYNCGAIDSDQSTLTLVEYTTRFEHNTPYIIQSTSENKKFTIIGWNKNHEDIVNNGLLYGVLTEGGAIVPAGSYVLAREKSTDKQAFYLTDGTVTCPQYKCYLTVPAAAENPVKAFYFENSGLETSIESVMGADEETAIYNLNGQQLKRMQKGINIVNGRKIVVK